VRQLKWAKVVAEAIELRVWLTHRPKLAPEVARPVTPETCHHLQRLECHPAVHATRSFETEELMVARQGADPDAQPVAPLGQVVEIRNPVSQLGRVVIGQQVAKRSQTDSPGTLQSLGNQQVGSRARLPRPREVLADSCLVKAEVVEPLKLFKVPTLAVYNAPFPGMRRHEEGAQSHRTLPTLASDDLAAPLPYTKSESAKV
jgi:hypothetical protein